MSHTRTKRNVTAVCALVSLLALMQSHANAQPFYHLVASRVLPGKSPAWDYLSIDAQRSRLFIGRRHGGVTVVDMRDQSVVGQVGKSEGANMATLLPELDRGYTTNGDGSTTVFQLSTLKTLDRVKLGDSADAAYFEPLSQTLAFMRGDDHAITFVDAKTARVIGDLTTKSGNLEAAVAEGDGRLIVAERDLNALLVVDVRTRTVVAEWPVAHCEQPTGMAMDRKNHRVFVGCRGASPVVAVVDAATGQTVTTLTTGRGNDTLVYDADTRRVFASNGIDGNLVIYKQADPDHYQLDQAFTTRPMARTMAYDPASGNIYTVTAEGVADPAKPINTGPAPFYPNSYFDDTFTLLTYSQSQAAVKVPGTASGTAPGTARHRKAHRTS